MPLNCVNHRPSIEAADRVLAVQHPVGSLLELPQLVQVVLLPWYRLVSPVVASNSDSIIRFLSPHSREHAVVVLTSAVPPLFGTAHIHTSLVLSTASAAWLCHVTSFCNSPPVRKAVIRLKPSLTTLHPIAIAIANCRFPVSGQKCSSNRQHSGQVCAGLNSDRDHQQ